MAKKMLIEETKFDITAMIDVVFLLIIFFILMPQREMDYRLEAHLPTTGPEVTNPTPTPPDHPFRIKITGKKIGEDEIVTFVYFNQRPVCEFVTSSLKELDRIYELPQAQKKAKLDEEHLRDRMQFDPKNSAEIATLMRRLNAAAIGAVKGKKTKIIIDASPEVPFKVVLAILNATKGEDFINVAFQAPDQSIWNQD